MKESRRINYIGSKRAQLGGLGTSPVGVEEGERELSFSTQRPS